MKSDLEQGNSGTMNKVITISVGTIVALAVGLVIGFFLGKAEVEPTPAKTQRIITWARGKETIKEVPVPEPYAVHDTAYIVKEVPIPTDTAALFKVWKDYHLTRDYDLDFSDDSLGVFKVKFAVHQNKVASSPVATIQPNIKIVTEENTVYKVPFIQGYAMVGTSVDFSVNQIQLGIDLKQKFLIGVSGIRIKDNYGYTINAGIKF